MDKKTKIRLGGAALLIAGFICAIVFILTSKDKNSANPLNKNSGAKETYGRSGFSKFCQPKDCMYANRFFYYLADDLQRDPYNLSIVKTLKCQIGNEIFKEEKQNLNASSFPPGVVCQYFTGESFRKTPRLNQHAKIRETLLFYENLLLELLASVNEIVKDQHQLISNFNDIETGIKLLYTRVQLSIVKYNACECDFSMKVKEKHVQDYRSLRQKYSGRKSAFVVLKQLELVHRMMKRIVYVHQKQFFVKKKC